MNHMLKPYILCFCLLLYGVIILPFSTYMHQKPVEEKLGYVPSLKLIKFMSADHKELSATALVLKVIMYYGGLIDRQANRIETGPPDHQMMSRMLFGATNLDPYNMDAYYFAQAFLVWDAKQVAVANQLLEHGMKYRTWDWYLPFFAAFNNAYFLKDYAKAAELYKKSGELSGSELYISLSSRYMQEAGQTAHAIAYLKLMIGTTKNETAKKSYKIRLQAFEEVRLIELAIDAYTKKLASSPDSIEILLAKGFLQRNPVDPYGGRFYLDHDGKVLTTSKYAFKTKK